MFIDIIKGFIL